MSAEENKVEKEHCFCPYCDKEIAEVSLTYCSACGVTVFYCPECHKPVPRDKKECPSCGAKIKG